MAMPAVTSKFIIQFTGDDGTWIDVDENPVRLTAENLFRDYRKKIPKTRNVRLIKRTEEVLGIRI